MPDTFDPARVSWVMVPEDLDYCLLAISSADEVVMDLETTGLDEHAPRAAVVLASLTLLLEDQPEPTTWVVPLAHPESVWLGHWREVLRRVALEVRGRPLSNHNVKFDCRWVKAHTGVDLSGAVVWDTMVSSHLLDENRSAKLKDRAPETFGVARWDDFDLSSEGAANDVPLFDLGLYAARDTYWTAMLRRRHREQMFLDPVSALDGPQTPDEVEDARLGRLMVWTSVPTVSTLTAVEQRGIVLDRDWTRDRLATNREGMAGLFGSLVERAPGLAGEPSFAPTSLWFLSWADEMVNKGALTVAELTPKGRPRWSAGVLVRQARAGSGAARDLLALRRLTKQNEYLTAWLHFAGADGVVHSHYNVGSVITGRLSSSEPNMQQVTADLRPAWIPRPGYFFAELDYSQIELRMAAFISRCVPMLEAFRRGDDLHKMLASRITGKPVALVTPVERQAGKSANFGLLFGMGTYGFREYAETVYGVSFTMDEAAAVRRAFFDTWTGLEDWHRRVTTRAHRDGQVVSPIGRIRRLPEIDSMDDGKAGAAERAGINAPVQGFASDLMQMAAASIEGRLPGSERVEDAFIVATVHDQILAEVAEGTWKAVALECRERMLTIGDQLARLDCNLDVPLAASLKIGTRWGLSDVAVLE
jgi:DNA polymerase-1